MKYRLDSLHVPNNYILYENDGHELYKGPNADNTYKAIKNWMLTLY